MACLKCQKRKAAITSLLRTITLKAYKVPSGDAMRSYMGEWGLWGYLVRVRLWTLVLEASWNTQMPPAYLRS